MTEVKTEERDPPVRIRVTFVSGPDVPLRMSVIGRRPHESGETSLMASLEHGQDIEFDVDEGKVLSLGIQNPDRTLIRKYLREGRK